MELIKKQSRWFRAEENQGRVSGELIYVAIVAAVLSLAAYGGAVQLYVLLYVGACLLGLSFDPYAPLYIRLSVLYASSYVETSNTFALVVWFLTVGPIILHYILKRKEKIEKNKLIFVALSATAFLLSCIQGIETRYTSFIMQTLYVLAFLCAASMGEPKRLRLAFQSFVISGVFVCVVVFSDLIAGTAHWIGYGTRLTFLKNERDLANAMTVPVYYYLYRVIGDLGGDGLFAGNKEKKFRFADVLKLLPFVTLLVLSYSRGNYLAIIVPFVYVLIVSQDLPCYPDACRRRILCYEQAEYQDPVR